jgi:phospholipid/cholesterol/gamma-HCH transport system ATP-binding protein
MPEAQATLPEAATGSAKPRAEERQDTVVATGICKSFGDLKVLNGVDLRVKDGETVSVLGRSGTGKSVLLKLLIGLEKPDSGSIQIDGHDIAKLSMEQLNEVRKKIGFLFQQAALYDSLTLIQNVEFPLSRHTNLKAQERTNRSKELLSSVCMSGDLEKLPAEISGGMKKRVGLARALALDPKLIMLDEPTAGLDPVTGAEIAQLILDLKKTRPITSIVVTHDLRTARTISDRFVVLQKGEVLVDGTFVDLRRSKDPFIVQFLQDAG